MLRTVNEKINYEEYLILYTDMVFFLLSICFTVVGIRSTPVFL